MMKMPKLWRATLIRDAGFDPVDVGPLRIARYIEPFALLVAQRWGGPIEEIRPGEVVWFSPGEKPWHGASPTTAMAHIAIQEKLPGKVVDWMGHGCDEHYQG